MTALRIVLDNSVAFSLLFAGVWLVKTALRKHLSARMQYFIWAAVIASLLIPARIDVGVSLWNLLPGQAAESVLRQTRDLQPANDTGAGTKAGGSGGIQPPGQPAPANGAPSARASQPARTGPAGPAAGAVWSMVLLVLWLTGMAAALLWLFLGSARLRRNILRCGSRAAPPWLGECAGNCGRALGLRRNVRVVLQPVLPMPAVMGIFHPILAMPESAAGEGSAERVRHILMHEFCHVRRGDLIAVTLLNILSAVYWFNPLVWLCFGLVREDMEASCDSDALIALGGSRRQEYIRTLVHFSGMGGRSREQAALSLHDGKIKMKKRIGAMFMMKKTKPAVAAPVILLVLALLLAASTTGCLPVASGAAASGSPQASAAPDPSSPASTQTSAPESAAAQTTGAGQTPEPSPSAEPEATPPAPVETTAPEASQWEDRYRPVLEKYREFAESFGQGNGGGDFSAWDDPWDMIAPDMMYSTQKFGYAFRDLDGNGTPELFLLTDDGSIWAMYTFVDGAPKLLGTYWSRNSCVLDGSDALFTNWSDGAADCGQDAYRISKDGRALELAERVAMESTDENGNPLDEPRRYKCVGSESNKKIITEAEADAETAKFPENNDNSGLEFTPLG